MIFYKSQHIVFPPTVIVSSSRDLFGRRNMLCKIIAVLAIATISSTIVSAATDKVVCYLGTWARYRTGNGQFLLSNIDSSLCTHLIYSFVGINSTGDVISLDTWLDYDLDNFNQFNALKTANPELKTLLAIGGWNEGSTKYSTVSASSELRANFIKTALSMVQTYGFDGFDLDWEYPAQRGGSSSDVANFALLLQEFRETFDQYGLLLSAAVAAPLGLVELSYDVPSLSKYLDFINVMAYDLHASWDSVLGHNAPLYESSIDTTDASKLLNLKSIVESWIAKGADPQKLVLGLPMYGRTFTLASTSNVAVGDACTGVGTAGPYTAEAGMLGYNEIIEKQLAGGWTIVWDDEQKVPHMYNGDQWVSYDNVESITLKVEYAKSMNLTGVMIWSIETEDFLGLSGTAYPLLTAIKTALADSTTVVASTNATSSDSTSSAADTIVVDSTNSTSDTSNDTGSNITSSNTTSTATNSDESSAVVAETTSTCTGVGYFRDATNCSQFYQCYYSGTTLVATLNTCSTGLYFDTTVSACNWASLVDC